MTIPAITPYPMPAGTSLPDNTARWTIEPRRVVLLVHDMQNYFLRPFPADAPPATDLVRNVAALRESCAANGIPVVYTAQPGDMTPDERGLLRDFWGAGMSAAPEHRDILPGVAPAPGDTVFTKWRPSAFFRTGLLDLLRERQRDQLVLCGVYAHVGILLTACDGFANDIQTFVVADAVADFSEQHHRMALDYAASRCAMTLPTDTVLAMLTAVGAR